MKKFLFIVAGILLIGFFVSLSFKGSQMSTEQEELKKGLETLAQIERNSIAPEPSDFKPYTSENFGFTMNIPKVISVYENEGTIRNEKDDSVVVKENKTNGIVYLVAKSNESIITESGQVLSTTPPGSTVFMSTIFIRPLERWRDVDAVLLALVKDIVPSDVPLTDLKVKSVDRHTGSNIYTAIFAFSIKDESGAVIERLLPVNFKAVFSSEFKKVALWLVDKDYVFGHTVSGSIYKVFDDAMFDSLVFVK